MYLGEDSLSLIKSNAILINLYVAKLLGDGRCISSMTIYYLARRAMLDNPEIGWKKVKGSQTRTWHRLLTLDMRHAGRCRLLG